RRVPARPPCIACSQGEIAVATAIARLADRSSDGAWATVLAGSPFCLDEFLLLWQKAGSRRGFEPVATRQVERFEDLRRRLDGYAPHPTQFPLQLMTQAELSSAAE